MTLQGKVTTCHGCDSLAGMRSYSVAVVGLMSLVLGRGSHLVAGSDSDSDSA